MNSRLDVLGILSVLPFLDPCQGLGFCYNKTVAAGPVDLQPINYKVKNFMSLNLPDCAKECAYEETCMSFSVNTNTGLCILSSRPLSDLNTLKKDGWAGFDFTDGTRTPAAAEQPTELWIDSVTAASSEYDVAHGAAKIIGPPDVYPNHGDLAGAWASKNWSKGDEWIKVKIAQLLYILQLDIYETYHPGGTKNIQALQSNGVWDMVWTTPQLIKLTASRINSITLEIDYTTDQLWITTSGQAAQYWVELDAVKVIGWPA
ncbi:F-box/LRR-repeat protein 4-like [Haliotis asinina]|uniref:F-box/LRR-repeat protein 4-like n=1 Tax=Haliotis asinina TaxID=109174 RepID=UPI00353263FC